MNYILMGTGKVAEDAPCDVDMAERIDPDDWKTEFVRENKAAHDAIEDMYGVADNKGVGNLSIKDVCGAIYEIGERLTPTSNELQNFADCVEMTMTEVETKIKDLEDSIQALEMKLEALHTQAYRANKQWQTAVEPNEALHNALQKLR